MLILAGSALAMPMVYTNCTHENLSPLVASSAGSFTMASVNAQFCTSAPSSADQNIKYLFILDHSALNKPGIPLVPADTTNADADGSRRYGPLLNFIQGMITGANVHVYYDVIDFNDQAQEANGFSGFITGTNINGQTPATLITNDWIGQGTQANPSPIDSGFTDYKAALGSALTIIQQDMLQSSLIPTTTPVTNSYQIIFVSGGVPVIGTTPITYEQYASDLQPVVNNITALKNDPKLGQYVGGIVLNTAYYYNINSNPDPNAITILQQMANSGNGLFINFGGSQQILYQQFVPAQQSVINQLVDVYIENKNAIWWDNGVLMQDTDGDGIPDAIEAQIGSSGKNGDSDGNGVSDLVEYRTTGSACRDSNCSPANAQTYTICAGYNPVVNQGVTSFDASAKDGLNDCEKTLLGANPQSFSSSGDSIPDFLALKNTISVKPNNPTVAMIDPFGDGATNYYKLKLGAPIQVSQRSIASFQPRTTMLTLASSALGGSNCYNLVVNNVAVTAPDNTIRVSVIQAPSIGTGQMTLMYAEGKPDVGSQTLSLTPSQFK